MIAYEEDSTILSIYESLICNEFLEVCLLPSCETCMSPSIPDTSEQLIHIHKPLESWTR